MSQARIAIISAYDSHVREPAAPYTEKPVHGHGARVPPTMNPGGLARDEELLDRTTAERAGDRVLRPFQLFAQRQASGGLVLLGCAILALAWANSPWAWAYRQMLGVPLGISLGDQMLRLDLRHWINDGLMALFFFGVGLEIKREFLVGELAERRNAMLPIVAAVGGMVVPALIYAGFNFNGAGAKGWGIPMATDIAFALGALAILGSRIPEALKVFLVALAIVDDLGALLVIAIFYTASIDWRGVALIAVLLLALWVANRIGARRGSIYLLLGLGLWAGFFISGLHATLAGVLTALFVPARVKIVPGAVPQVIRRGADNIEAQSLDNEPEAMHPDRVAIIGAIGGSLDAATAPLQRFEHLVQPWVTYGILPAFGLFNAGVAIDAAVLRTLPTAVSLGIMVGLVLGKSVGIGLASWLAVRTGLAALPEGATWRQLIGTAFLAGIGFTMALFIGGLAFAGTPFEREAQLAVLIGALLAAVIGIAILLTSKAGVRRSPGHCARCYPCRPGAECSPSHRQARQHGPRCRSWRRFRRTRIRSRRNHEIQARPCHRSGPRPAQWTVRDELVTWPLILPATRRYSGTVANCSCGRSGPQTTPATARSSNSWRPKIFACASSATAAKYRTPKSRDWCTPTRPPKSLSSCWHSAPTGRRRDLRRNWPRHAPWPMPTTWKPT